MCGAGREGKERAGRSAQQAAASHLPAALAEWRGLRWLEVGKRGTYLQEGPEGGSVTLTLVLRKVMEQLILSAITWQVEDRQLTKPSQQGLREAGPA